MDTLNSLLRAIITLPDEDTPRLMYADALQELPTRSKPCPSKGRGCNQPAYNCPSCKGLGTVTDTSASDRAEFIRVQVEIARLPSNKYGCRKCTSPAVKTPTYIEEECCCQYKEQATKLRKREEELWNFGSSGTWVEATKPFLNCIQCIDRETISREHARDPILIYRRGFVDSVTCTAEDFLKHADSLVWNWKCQAVGISHKDTCSGGRVQSPNAQFTRECSQCNGTGITNSPCPDTAHPIRKVRLTSLGDDPVRFLVTQNFTTEGNKGTSPKWPGIEFELPPVEHPFTEEGVVATAREMMDEMGALEGFE